MALFPLFLTVAFIYLFVVRLLRYRIIERLESAPGFKDNCFDSMTPLQAQRIFKLSFFYECPTALTLGFVVALVKVWAIPSMSFILTRSGKKDLTHILSRRFMDTGILLATCIMTPLSGPGSGEEIEEGYSAEKEVDPRGAIALARINWLHRKYKIAQEDYQYTLSLLIIEPIDFTNRFGWRKLSPMEQQAMFVFWKEIGRRMNISTDIWGSVEELRTWKEAYERINMVYSKSCASMMQAGISHFSKDFYGHKLFTEYYLGTLIGARARQATGLSTPPWMASYLIHGVLLVAALFTCHVSLPRSKPAPWVTTEDPRPDYMSTLAPGELPRMPAVFKKWEPWYYPQSTGLKRILEESLVQIGLQPPSMIPSTIWRCDGYRLEEIGPAYFQNIGHGEVMKNAEKLLGRPITGPWSRSP
ncbi:ER-bound oxygenase mpaB/B' [Abortiporus biennis]